jgi:ABC-2 type transport system ATP-binding protein
VIKVENLTKMYGNRAVVNNVTFQVGKGEIFGYLGKNGAGKSTTINMITGIVRPTSGKVFLFGQDVLENPSVIYQKVGVLPDSSNFYPAYSSLDHLTLFGELKRVKIKKQDLYQLLERVGLQGHEKKKVHSYSLGMKKKLGIAQALIGDPEIIFLDEPTSTLDPESAIEIRELIFSLSQQGKTIFMTSHNLEEVEKICHRVAIMQNGTITQMGTLRELREKNQASIHVYLVTKQEANAKDSFIQSLKQRGIFAKSTESGFHLKIDSDQVFPEIISIAVREGISIYRVQFEEVSLEKIFLESKATQ